MITPEIIPDAELDIKALTRELDKVKVQVFTSRYNNAAFLGSLMCSLSFQWTRSIPTAGTNEKEFFWNPDYFNSLPAKSRETDLLHELWHVGLMHTLRKGDRDHTQWNIACDIFIDLILEDMGCSFEGINGVERDPKYRGMAEEEIYDDLMKDQKTQKCSCCSGDLKKEITPESKQELINMVTQAVLQEKAATGAGSLPGAVKETLDMFLNPVVPWRAVLNEFFTDLVQEGSTWARPNRRHQDIYLPSPLLVDDNLDHLIYYIDTSYSTSNKEVAQFNSEVKYIFENLHPKKLSLVQFDTRIQKEDVFTEGDEFKMIEVVGRGGTSFVCVREHIIKNKPTAAIIFSDMECRPMEKLPFDIPIIWAVIRNKNVIVPFGKVIEIKD